jgi:hypothetical protein
MKTKNDREKMIIAGTSGNDPIIFTKPKTVKLDSMFVFMMRPYG